MSSIFGDNTDFNINFSDAAPSTFENPNVDGRTNVDRTFGNNIGNRYLISGMDIKIILNNNLSIASKEYITATIMHEAFHAYLYQSRTIINQHLEMATNYINTMTQQLMQLYPTLSEPDARALTWIGLEKDAPTLYNNLTTAEKNNIIITGRNFKTGQTGHSCN